MRTTIEIRPEHRARLLEIAAMRGEKGFSSVIAEAIDAYLKSQSQQEELRAKALRTRGTLGKQDGDALRRRVSEIRAHWR